MPARSKFLAWIEPSDGPRISGSVRGSDDGVAEAGDAPLCFPR
jgi:hypothetical protein